MSEMSSCLKKYEPTVSHVSMDMARVPKKSLSLSDISSLTDLRGRFPEVGGGETFNLSTETIGSHFGKDSGYVHSASVSSLNSSATDFKHHTSVSHYIVGDEHLSNKVAQLMKELQDRKILIEELEKSNLNLRLQCAAAQSKITELRIKCEEHCQCCPVVEKSSNCDGQRNTLEEDRKWMFQKVDRRPTRCSSLQSLDLKTSTPVKHGVQRNAEKVAEWNTMLFHSTNDAPSLLATGPAFLRSGSDQVSPVVSQGWWHSRDNIPSPIPRQTSVMGSETPDDTDEEEEKERISNFFGCNLPFPSYSRSYKNRKEEMESIIRSHWSDIAHMEKTPSGNLSKFYTNELPKNYPQGASPLLISLYEASHFANDLTKGLLSMSMPKINEE